MAGEEIHFLIESVRRAREEAARVIIGQREAVDMALITIMTRNHALIEGVPGIAKTLLVRTLAQILGVEFSRIQFTPDLMPTDILGTNIFNLQESTFSLVKGPIFTSFLLADEINRAPAKTQSALLQAMQERTVTIDRETQVLSDAFTVFATQNPIEYEGTYPLPEAQKDRFLFKILMAYPSRDEEAELAQRNLSGETPEAALAQGQVQAVLGPGELERLRRALEGVVVRDELRMYMVDLIRQTRVEDSVLVGAGPRATLAVLLASRAHAALDARDFVTPDDVREVLLPVLDHRLVLRPEQEMEGMAPRDVVDRIMQQVAVPR